VARWLLAVAALVFIMVVLGGVTRLTESGLSMTDWRPVTGWLPPMSEAAWEAELQKYRASPEYKQINTGMTVAEFKTIFWFEYSHRLLGRLIGLAFFVPFVIFLVRRKLEKPLALRLWVLFALGALQGFLGWFMVKSGLVDRPSVSQYRLALHLAMALLIYGAIIWTMLGLTRRADYGAGEAAIDPVRRRAWCLFGLVSVTVVAGAFVAGLDAGLYFNTFPLIDGRLVPQGYFDNEPVWRAPFEAIAAVQFNHRLIAVVTVVAVIIFWLAHRGRTLSRRSQNLSATTALMVLVQAGLGIATLLAYVPVWLGALHQAGALVLFTLCLMLVHSLRRADRA
tara:strand:+ start:19844 stop:20857 length:1014 start_codon:yes stop_codon:yes gene_type:complete